MNLKFVVSTDGKIKGKERKLIEEAYYNLFIQMYGRDLFDSFLTVANIDEASSYRKRARKHAKNYNRSVEAIERVKEDENFAMFLIYNKETNKLVGAGRMRKIDEEEAIVPDIVVLDDYKEERMDILKKSIDYVDDYLSYQGFQRMYLEVPLNDANFLFLANDLGFVENPEDIVTNEDGQRTYLLNTDLTRYRDEKPNYSRK